MLVNSLPDEEKTKFNTDLVLHMNLMKGAGKQRESFHENANKKAIIHKNLMVRNENSGRQNEDKRFNIHKAH